MSNMKELVVSWIRTALVPPLAAILVQWLLSHQLDIIDKQSLVTGLTIFLTGVWYLVFRAIEIVASNPKIKRLAGIFLGYPRTTKVVPV